MPLTRAPWAHLRQASALALPVNPQSRSHLLGLACFVKTASRLSQLTRSSAGQEDDTGIARQVAGAMGEAEGAADHGGDGGNGDVAQAGPIGGTKVFDGGAS